MRKIQPISIKAEHEGGIFVNSTQSEQKVCNHYIWTPYLMLKTNTLLIQCNNNLEKNK